MKGEGWRMKQQKISIKTKLLGTILPVVLVIVIGLVTISYLVSRDIITESAKNLLTPTAPRCSHLGCALKWNNTEHSWDCPCHGSRFTEDGRVIDNPAKKEAFLFLKK